MISRALPPLAFGLLLLVAWQTIVVVAQIPEYLLPSPVAMPEARRVMSDIRASTVTAAPSAAGPGAAATARSRRSASRSCTTQCCGPDS